MRCGFKKVKPAEASSATTASLSEPSGTPPHTAQAPVSRNRSCNYRNIAVDPCPADRRYDHGAQLIARTSGLSQFQRPTASAERPPAPHSATLSAAAARCAARPADRRTPAARRAAASTVFACVIARCRRAAPSAVRTARTERSAPDAGRCAPAQRAAACDCACTPPCTRCAACARCAASTRWRAPHPRNPRHTPRTLRFAAARRAAAGEDFGLREEGRRGPGEPQPGVRTHSPLAYACRAHGACVSAAHTRADSPS